MVGIPIHDATVPIVCTAGREGLPERKAQIGRLRAFGPAVERTEHGLVLRFPNRPDVDAEVRDFAVAEKGCCSFWGFEVGEAGGRIALRWDGPPEVGGVLDQLAAFLTGDAPLDALDGLL
jgi:hypothetical protein